MNQQEATPPSTTPGKPADKKQIRKEISEKLTGALSEYKQELGEKKLASHVKKISKLISRELEKKDKKTSKKEQPKKPKKAKKVVVAKSPKKKAVKK